MADSDWVPVMNVEKDMKGYMKPVNPNDDMTQPLNTGDLGDSSKDSPEVIARAKAMTGDGWMPATPQQDGFIQASNKVEDDGWRPVGQTKEDDGWRPISPTPRKDDLETKREELAKQIAGGGPFEQLLTKGIQGTATNLTDMVGGLFGMGAGWLAHEKALGEGVPDTKALEESTREFESQLSPSANIEKLTGQKPPTNPIIDKALEALQAGVSKLTEPLEDQPTAHMYAQDLANLLVGYKPAKGMLKRAETGEKDVTSKGSHEFVEPESNPVTEALSESKAFNDKYGKHLPALYEAGKAGEEAFSEPPPSGGGPKASFSERHAEMVQKGEAVLANAKEQGLTPKDIHDEFWNNVYDNLPEEVQARFNKLAQQKSIRLTSHIDDLERMSRWYVALMHEANNYPWTPKAKAYLDNKIDAQQVDAQPDTYAERISQQPEAVGDIPAYPQIFPTLFPQDGGPVTLFRYLGQIKKAAEENKLSVALQAIEENSTDPFERMLARAFQHDAAFEIHDGPIQGTRLGSATFMAPSSTVRVFIDSVRSDIRAYKPQVILHEAFHSIMGHVIELGRDPITREKYPEYARFFDEYTNLITQITQRMTPEESQAFGKMMYGGNVEKLGAVGHEFGAYGLTSPKAVAFLSQFAVNKSGKVVARLNIPSDVLAETAPSLWDSFTKAAMHVLGLDKFEQSGRIEKELSDFLYIQSRTGEKYRTAFQELLDLVLPITKFAKENGIAKRPQEEVDLIYGARHGWLDKTMFNDPKPQANVLAESEIADEFPTPRKTIPTAVQGVLDRMVSPFDTPKEVIQWIHGQLIRGEHSSIKDYLKKHPDIGAFYPKVVPTVMVKNAYNNPVATFWATKLREVVGDTHALQKALFKQADSLFKQESKEDQAIITGMLAQVNRPEWQQQIQQMRTVQFGPDWKLDPKQFRLTTSDIPPETVVSTHSLSLYQRTLEPLFEVLHNVDNASLSRFGRTLPTEVVGYFPRYFGFGRFSVSGFDSDGKLAFYKRSRTFVENRKYEEAMKAAGLVTVREIGDDFAAIKGFLLALAEVDPNSAIGELAQNTIAAAEKHRRTQEFERNAFNVAGFIGQNMNNPREVKQLVLSVYHRVTQTSELYKAARLHEIVEELRKDPFIRIYYPNTLKWVEKTFQSEIGGDVSVLGAVDTGANWLMNKGHVAILKTFTKYADDLKPNELTIAPTASKEMVRLLTYVGSAWALVLNVANLAVNALSIPFVSLLGGLPDSVLLGKNLATAPYHAIKAHLQSLGDWAMLMSGKLNTNLVSPQLRAFMEKMDDEGYLAANMFNDMPQLRDETERSAPERVVSTTLNAVRSVTNDPIEFATNYMTLLYYRRLIQNLFPGMSEKQQLRHIIDLSDRYKGNYNRYNKQLMFKQAGILGESVSNFATWSGHRVAQATELMKWAILKAKVMPLVSLMVAGIIAAGVKGMPGAQDYENIRQWGLKTKIHDVSLFEIPPIDLLLRKADVPPVIREGIVNENPLGVDLAGRGKWAGFTDISGVTWMLPGKLYDIGRWVYKANVHTEGQLMGKYYYEGTNLEDDADLVMALPSAAQGLARQNLLTRNFRGDNRATILSKKGYPTYTQMDSEVKYNLFNLKTVRQAHEQDEAFNTLYTKKSFETERDALKKAGLEQLIHAANERKLGNVKRADEIMKDARTNLQRLAKVDPSSFTTLREDILKGVLRETDTTYEKTVKQMARSDDAGMIITLFNSIRFTDQYRNQKASPPSSPSQSK